MRLHDRLRELRQERGLLLREVAERCPLSVPFISDLERGRAQNPGLDILQHLARAYDITLRDLLASVEFGDRYLPTLPDALRRLVDDPTHGHLITPEWQRTLAGLEHLGSRPSTPDDYLTLFLSLRRILE